MCVGQLLHVALDPSQERMMTSLFFHGRGGSSLVPRPSRNAERGSGVLSDISWRMGRGYTA